MSFVKLHNDLIEKLHVRHALNFIANLVNLGLRVYVANIFFKSGLVKIKSFESTIDLFYDYYQVPLLNPVFAAYSGTFVELVFPVFLVLGIFTRLAAIPLLMMVLTIQFLLPDPSLQSPEHYIWMGALAILIAQGGRALSADHFIAQKFGFRRL
jgi:putative oxidoreductase